MSHVPYDFWDYLYWDERYFPRDYTVATDVGDYWCGDYFDSGYWYSWYWPLADHATPASDEDDGGKSRAPAEAFARPVTVRQPATTYRLAWQAWGSAVVWIEPPPPRKRKPKQPAPPPQPVPVQLSVESRAVLEWRPLGETSFFDTLPVVRQAEDEALILFGSPVYYFLCLPPEMELAIHGVNPCP